MVQQGEVVVVGDSVVYDQQTGDVLVTGREGRQVVLRDPTQASDIVAGAIRYNVRTARGSVSNVRTSVVSGEQWYVSAARAAIVNRPAGDTTSAVRFYGHDGSITSCNLTEPHYHFEARNMKVVKGSIMVARPAVLYIGEVPVMWLPFIFQDMRSGRRSGIMAPRFGVAELIRNSPTYRRSVENLGYYFAISDYLDASVWLDWRSGARSTKFDPGLIRYNGEMQYRWKDRFLSGRLASGYEAWRDGRRNLTVSWQHQQQFSQRTSFTSNVNYAQSTILQQLGAFVPAAALATIGSNVNYQTKRGPFSIGLGGDRRQYTGQDKVDMTLPSLNISSEPIGIGDWLTWTPTLTLRNSVSQNLPVAGELGLNFGQLPTGGFAVDTLKFDRRTTTIAFNTPIKLFGFDWQNSFNIDDFDSDGPVRATIFNSTVPGDSSVRVFAREFRTRVDWRTSFGLPSFFQGRWNVSPSVSIENVEGTGGFLVRSYLSGGKWVAQPKRVSANLAVGPTFFRQYGGFGPFAGFLHAVQPQLAYSWAPQATVGDDYLQAVGLNPATYIGSAMRSSMSFTLNTYIEAKLPGRGTTTGAAPAASSDSGAPSSGVARGAATLPAAADAGQKLKLISLGFTPLAYDFVRADSLGASRGITTETFGYTAQSDLLPGFSLAVQYSLFNGPASDTRSTFKPYRTGVNASFSVSRETNALALLSRVFGLSIPLVNPDLAKTTTRLSDTTAGNLARRPVAGSSARVPVQQLETGQGWRASLSYSSNRTRPDLLGTVVQFDPATQCNQYRAAPGNQYEQCVDYVRRNPPSQDSLSQQQGNVRVVLPAQSSINSELAFDLTPNWSASWRTSYDFTRSEFASHVVSLQRDLHDWRAIFAFTQSPNGNFAFNFFISLKAEPEIKFDYNRQSYRGQGAIR